MTLGESEDVATVSSAVGGELPGSANEPFDLPSRREDDVGQRVSAGLVADGVGTPAGNMNDVAGLGEDSLHAPLVVFEVDREVTES